MTCCVRMRELTDVVLGGADRQPGTEKPQQRLGAKNKKNGRGAQQRTPERRKEARRAVRTLLIGAKGF